MLAKLRLSEEAVYVSVLAFCKEKEKTAEILNQINMDI